MNIARLITLLQVKVGLKVDEKREGRLIADKLIEIVPKSDFPLLLVS